MQPPLNPDRPRPLTPGSVRRGSIDPWILGAILLSVTTWRIWIAAVTGLGDAEAYYWTWSRELAPSYLDHGPLVALLIRLGTEILGDTPLGVRLPFVLLSTVTLLLLARTAAELAARETAAASSPGPPARAGLWASLVLLAMPAFLVAGGAGNPDGPFALLVLLVLRALLAISGPRSGDRQPVRFAFAGLLVGLALSAKLFGLLLLPVLLGAALLRRDCPIRTRLGLGLLALVGSALGALPVLYWNLEHGWPTLAYHLLARHTQPVGPSLQNLGKLLGGQLAYASPLGILAIGAAAVSLIQRRRARSLSARASVLLVTAGALSLPGLLLILIVPGAEPHWPMAGYLPLAIWAGLRLPEWQRSRRSARVCTRLALGFTILSVALLQIHVTTDLGVRVLTSAGLYHGRYDLGNELRGWPEVAAEAARLVAAARRDTRVAGAHYTTCAQLAFAARGRYRVVCPSPRRDQFDHRIGGDGSQLRGVDLLYLKDDRFPFDAAVLFRCAGGVTRSSVVEMQRAHRVVRRFVLQLCHRFGGLALQTWPPPADPSPRR